MDSYEFNKIAGWGIAAVIAVLGTSIVSHEIYKPEKPEKQSYIVAGVIEEATTAAAPAVADKPIAFYLASADATKGEAVFKKCGACHNAEKGGANGIGPNLYGIVGSAHARTAGFGYSEVLSGMKGKPWSWDELSAWLANPKGYAPGTKMAFAGVSKPEDRAALLIYLNSKSDAPLPVPAAPAEVAAEPAADAAAKPAADAAAPAADAAPAATE